MSASTERILPCPGATALPCARCVRSISNSLRTGGACKLTCLWMQDVKCSRCSKVRKRRCIPISTQSYPLASALLQLQDRALGMTQSERESRDFIAQCTKATKEFNACRIVEGKDLASSKREAQDEHVESARPLKRVKFSDAPDISGDAGNPVPERTSSK